MTASLLLRGPENKNKVGWEAICSYVTKTSWKATQDSQIKKGNVRKTGEMSHYVLGLKFCDCSSTPFLIRSLWFFFRFLSITTMRSTSSSSNPTDKLMIIASSAASELEPGEKQSHDQLLYKLQGSKLRPIQSHLRLNFRHLRLKFANLRLNFRV